MRKIILLLIIFFSGYHLYAQSPGRLVYFEAGGPGLASFNYDQRFNNTDEGWGFRVGIGGYLNHNAGTMYFPLGINYAVSRDNRNFFEVGAGVTFVSTSEPSSTDLFKNTFGHLSFAYRMQPRRNGIFYKLALTPVFGSGSFYPYIPAVGFGFKF